MVGERDCVTSCDTITNGSCPALSSHPTNWAKTYVCDPLVVFEPCTVRRCTLIFELAKREGKTVRAVGVGHSPSDLAHTNEYAL